MFGDGSWLGMFYTPTHIKIRDIMKDYLDPWGQPSLDALCKVMCKDEYFQGLTYNTQTILALAKIIERAYECANKINGESAAYKLITGTGVDGDSIQSLAVANCGNSLRIQLAAQQGFKIDCMTADENSMTPQLRWDNWKVWHELVTSTDNKSEANRKAAITEVADNLTIVSLNTLLKVLAYQIQNKQTTIANDKIWKFMLQNEKIQTKLQEIFLLAHDGSEAGKQLQKIMTETSALLETLFDVVADAVKKESTQEAIALRNLRPLFYDIVDSDEDEDEVTLYNGWTLDHLEFVGTKTVTHLYSYKMSNLKPLIDEKMQAFFTAMVDHETNTAHVKTLSDIIDAYDKTTELLALVKNDETKYEFVHGIINLIFSKNEVETHQLFNRFLVEDGFMSYLLNDPALQGTIYSNMKLSEFLKDRILKHPNEITTAERDNLYKNLSPAFFIELARHKKACVTTEQIISQISSAYGKSGNQRDLLKLLFEAPATNEQPCYYLDLTSNQWIQLFKMKADGEFNDTDLEYKEDKSNGEYGYDIETMVTAYGKHYRKTFGWLERLKAAADETVEEAKEKQRIKELYRIPTRKEQSLQKFLDSLTPAPAPCFAISISIPVANDQAHPKKIEFDQFESDEEKEVDLDSTNDASENFMLFASEQTLFDEKKPKSRTPTPKKQPTFQNEFVTIEDVDSAEESDEYVAHEDIQFDEDYNSDAAEFFDLKSDKEKTGSFTFFSDDEDSNSDISENGKPSKTPQQRLQSRSNTPSPFLGGQLLSPGSSPMFWGKISAHRYITATEIINVLFPTRDNPYSDEVTPVMRRLYIKKPGCIHSLEKHIPGALNDLMIRIGIEFGKHRVVRRDESIEPGTGNIVLHDNFSNHQYAERFSYKAENVDDEPGLVQIIARDVEINTLTALLDRLKQSIPESQTDNIAAVDLFKQRLGSDKSSILNNKEFTMLKSAISLAFEDWEKNTTKDSIITKLLPVILKSLRPLQLKMCTHNIAHRYDQCSYKKLLAKLIDHHTKDSNCSGMLDLLTGASKEHDLSPEALIEYTGPHLLRKYLGDHVDDDLLHVLQELNYVDASVLATPSPRHNTNFPDVHYQEVFIAYEQVKEYVNYLDTISAYAEGLIKYYSHDDIKGNPIAIDIVYLMALCANRVECEMPYTGSLNKTGTEIFLRENDPDEKPLVLNQFIPVKDSSLNGTPVTGSPLLGTPLGTPITGSPLSGTSVTGSPLLGTPLGTPITGSPLSGTPVTGSPLLGNLHNGTPVASPAHLKTVAKAAVTLGFFKASKTPGSAKASPLHISLFKQKNASDSTPNPFMAIDAGQQLTNIQKMQTEELMGNPPTLRQLEGALDKFILEQTLKIAANQTALKAVLSNIKKAIAFQETVLKAHTTQNAATM